jgi:CheY-like chemotaxis protein
MEKRHKLLLVDDDTALLETYKELLSRLPSKPEIFTASTGSRAISILESEPFRLLICDLSMPRMDGLQVLSIVRRRFPKLRTVALTAINDEQFRSRAYALGVDLFWLKPGSEQDIQMFLECLESLLGGEADSTGFRGVQSKSLMDIVQLECISQSSSVLRISNGAHQGRIWIQDGEVIDAEAGELRGEAAFRRIFSWRGGGFETLAPEPDRERTIHQSYNGLLLESAQAMDEAANEAAFAAAGYAQSLSNLPELEFALVLREGSGAPEILLAPENPAKLSAWTAKTLEGFTAIGEKLHAGPIQIIEGRGVNRNVTIARQGANQFCLGWPGTLSSGRVRELSSQVISLWAS